MHIKCVRNLGAHLEYICKLFGNNGMFFNRIGLRYMLSKHPIANVTLLTHFAKADYFEWGMGYEF